MQEEKFDPTDYMSNIDLENQMLKQKNLEMAGALTNQSFSNEEDLNLIQYQLETDKILERCEHYLKGDVVKFNKNGSYFTEPTKNVLANVFYDPKTKITYYIQEIKKSLKSSEVTKNVLVKIINQEQDEVNVMEIDSTLILNKLKRVKLVNKGYQYVEVIDEEKKTLNEYGVAEFMRIISMYVTKEIFLSNHEEERIFEIMSDLGDALNDFLYCNYEKMGMDSKFKESKYTILILNILHIIEACYRRSIGGAEQENMRTRAIVTQNQGGQNFGGGGLNQNQLPPARAKKGWNPLKPSTW